MKENQMEVIQHSNGYEKGADLLSFPSCDPENDHGQTNLDTLARRLAIVDDFWNNGVAKNSELVEDHLKNVTENGYVPFVQNQQVPGWHSSDDETVMEPLKSTTNDNDEIHTSPANLDEFNPRSETPSSSVSGLLDPDTYTDKNVVECEMPDLDVPSSVHAVKDICVDTGTAPQERILMESDKENHGALITPQHAKGDLSFESIDGDFDAADESEGSAVAENVKKNSSNNFASWEKFESVDEEPDSVADIVSEESSSMSSTRVSGEFMMEDSLLNSLKLEADRVAQQSDEVPSMDTILESLAVMFNSKESKKEDQMSKLSYNSKVEDGTITFDFKGASKPISEEEDANANVNAPLTNENPKAEINDAAAKKEVDSCIFTASTNTSTSTTTQEATGESSFSRMEPVSGLITYSGQIAYAGSTSLRSDSSTTSTRSFAFPVLQSEWNSSPVRMHKAAPRRRRRHNWHSFLCCRF